MATPQNMILDKQQWKYMVSIMQLRELLEEQARLQSENRIFKQQLDSLQEKADEAAALKLEVNSLAIGLPRERKEAVIMDCSCQTNEPHAAICHFFFE